MSESPRGNPNRLIDETSPYLQQHARNPVDWYPWGEEALQQARELDRPLFLSIGYSACHWCHVMEHESFENEAIAAAMNEYFINIKVDREERPDLDQIYMNAVLALTGRGGWPMSVFLTPDQKPFFGGTYWPPQARMGMPGFADVIAKVREAWIDRREAVLRGADELTDAVSRMGRPAGSSSQLSDSLLQAALRSLLNSADRRHGGFGQAPKFPHPMDVRLLLRAWKRFDSQDALDVVRLTLDKMAGGGIYDHLGGGFHRYSTDEKWLVPHFEKMLYDNALLTQAYVEAFQATGNEDYRRVACETLDYVLREMTQPEGGFYSTQDADSEGVEGRFFVWYEDEIVEHLGADDAQVFNDCYDVSAGGNWEGSNILNRVKTHAQAAQVLGVSEQELTQVLSRCKAKLLAVREKRVWPSRDDKVLVAWNGLMMSAMAQAAQVFRESRYAQAAADAADFVLQQMRSESGRLLHAYKDGRARFDAYLDDYAALVEGLIDVYQATFEPRYLEAAIETAETMLEQFWDGDEGGCFYTSRDHEQLIVRQKDLQDSATPSGNSLAATALLRLGRICGRLDLEERARQILEMMSGQLVRAPTSAGQALIALEFLLGPTHEIVVVGNGESPETQQTFDAVHSDFLPNKIVVHRSSGLSDEEISRPLQPLLRGKTADDTVSTYICNRGTCHAPVVGAEQAKEALQRL